eukprot:387188-Pyramimonas_sp.AAC.1
MKGKQSSKKKSPKEDELSVAQWRKIAAQMWPAQALAGDELEELKSHLDSGFASDVGGWSQRILEKYVKKQGLKWLNALHPFYARRPEYTCPPLTYVLDDWRTVELLLRIGADPNIRDSEGKSPLYNAAFEFQGSCRLRVIDMLLDSGANPVEPVDGDTTMGQIVTAVKACKGEHAEGEHADWFRHPTYNIASLYAAKFAYMKTVSSVFILTRAM